MIANPEIFFSYAWGDENEHGKSREKIVNELYESLINDKYQVVRDKYNLEYKGFISDFMGRIGKGKCIVVAISQKYLKSPYCMFELYEIARNSNFDKVQFREKVLPVMVEFVDFTNPAIIDEYFSFWENEYKEWDDLVKKRAGQLSVEQMQRYDKIKMIHQNFGRLTEWIIDMNTLSPQLLSDDNFAEIKKIIVKKGTEVLSQETVPTTKLIEEGHGFGWRLKKMPVFWITTVLASVIAILIIPWLFEIKNKDIGGIVRPAQSSFITIGNAGEHLLIVQDLNTKRFGYARTKDTSLFISLKYDDAGLFKKGVALVKNDGKYHWIKPDSTNAFHQQFDDAEDFKEDEAKVINGKDTFYINMEGKRVDDGVGIVAVNTNHRSKPPVIKEGDNGTKPGDSIVISMCKAICNTKGITGVEVSFRDPQSGKKYSLESKGTELEFDIPCYLKGKYISVTFRGKGKSDYLNVKLESFEIPEMFKNDK